MVQVVEAINRSGLDLPAGKVQTEKESNSVRLTGKFTSLEDIKKVQVAMPVLGSPVYVKDEIEVSSKDITIEYWDRYNEDGDSISLYLNNKPVLENTLLTKIKKSFTIHLDEKVNYLVLHAINTGTEPPNTASVTVKDGKKIQNVSLTSNLRTSGALKITLKE